MTHTTATPKPLHIFKPGQWTTTAGEKIEFSEADLQASAQAYDPKKSKAPIVVGHPKTDDPAQGWAAGLTMGERGLYALPEKVDPEFAEAVRAGRYGTVSSKFYRPDDANNPVPGVWYLRHIGFLGAQPPAVKGLDAPEFADSDDGCVCFQEGVAFGEWDALTSAGLWRGLRDWFVAKFGLEEADKVLPSYQISSLEINANQDLQAPSSSAVAFAETGQLARVNHQPKESAVTDQEAAQLREQNAALLRQVQEAQKREHERQVAAIRQDNVAFAESLVSQARIPSAMKDQVAAIGAQLQATPDVEFGEGDAKKPLHVLFREFLQVLPAQVEFSETATRDRAAAEAGGTASTPVEFGEGADPARVQQDQRIRDYAKKHSLSYAAAAYAVMRQK